MSEAILLRALIVIDAASRYSSALIIGLLSVYILRLGGNLTHYGEMTGLLGILYGAFSILTSMYLMPYKKVLLPLSYIIWFIYALILFLTHDVYSLYFALSLSGLALSMRSTLFFSFMQDFIPNPPILNKTQSTLRFIGSLVGSMAIVSGAYIAHHYGFRLIFLIMMIIFLLAASFSAYTMVRIED